MNKIFVAATAILLSGVAASAADAALITQNYTTVSTFATGPYRTVTQKFRLTFDPQSKDSAVFANYSVDAGDVFSQSGTFERLYANSAMGGLASFADYYYFGKTPGPGGTVPGYRLSVSFDAVGGIRNSSLTYSIGQGWNFATTSVTTVDAPAVDTPNAGAVPEPTTWAMMLIGFGGIGFAMRRRTTTARIRFA